MILSQDDKGLEMTIPTLALGALLALLSAAAIFKIWRVHQGLYRVEAKLSRIQREFQNLFVQGEALNGLYADLTFRKSLPPTRGWAASPDFLGVLARHVIQARPKVILECGSGVSTVVLARTCELNGIGHVYSLEHLPDFAERTRSELHRHGLAGHSEILDAPLTRHTLDGSEWSWYGLQALPPIQFDMLVIDGPPGAIGPLARYPAGPLLFPHLKPGASVFLDDAHRKDEQDAVARWLRERPDLACNWVSSEKGCAVLHVLHKAEA
jgi:predicted O-methyltransferase YrrM